MIGAHNMVPDRPGWYFGLVVRHGDGSTTFEVIHRDGRKIEGVTAGRYRTERAARTMHSDLPSQERAAQEAISAADEERKP